MFTTEYVVRLYELPRPDLYAPSYTDTVFLTSDSAKQYLKTFNELDEVTLFTRESDRPNPYLDDSICQSRCAVR